MKGIADTVNMPSIFTYNSRAGSRISRRGAWAHFLGGFGLRRGHFSVKIYVKMKELGPVGGRAPACPLDPPMNSVSKQMTLTSLNDVAILL